MSEEADSTSDKGFKRKKVARKISETYLSNSGKFYLERFPASTEQFRRVMTRKIRKSCAAWPEQDFSTCLAMLETVIVKFQNIGFLNDAGYAAGLARSLKSRGWPRSRILMRLREKGISPDIIDTSVHETGENEDFRDALVWIRRKKLGAFSTKERSFEKSLASLARAGFDYHSASRALSLSRDEVEDVLKSYD